MLKKIKSTYFSINVLNYLDEKRKLELIKYNKALQEKLDIRIINYKFLSVKYIIYEGNDIWKVYDAFNNNLIFEGNYINGIGKEYTEEGELKYEGGYLKGKRNRNFKGYDNGKLISEGIYKNGLGNGICITYYKIYR